MNSFLSKARAATPVALLAITLNLTLASCGGERSKDDASPVTPAPTPRLVVNTPQDITQESAENYDDNLNGLISGKTLKRWVSNWEKERPAGITGKLVILQATRGPSGFEFIKPDNKHVFTYLENNWRESRTNGVTEIAGIVISGPTTDKLIRRYGIDVKNDLIVCAQGTGGNAAMDQGRCWYTFRYWGVDKKNLAVLNGGNNYLGSEWSASDFTATQFTSAVATQPSPIINKQVSSVRDLLVDNTILQATLEDVINVLPIRDTNDTADGVFLWDGRSLDQYSAGEATESGQTLTLQQRYSTFQNGGTRQGHPRGSVQLNWTNLIDTATGLYKTKAELRNYVEGGSDAFGKAFVDGTYQQLGLGNAYQKGDLVYLWCETSARAAVSQVVSAVILGLPTRLYDAAMIEWNSLSGGAFDKNGNPILPTDSPWRTDEISSPAFPNKTESISPRGADFTTIAPRIIDPYADKANAIIVEDKAYITPASTTPDSSTSSSASSSGGGVVLPPNPCGG
jgi:3-mercaptopyruvate sulfurtransferase SseA